MTTVINGSSPSITFSDGTTQASAGVVLQVVNATYSAYTTTTSTTKVSTSLTASITPKFSTSKILVLLSINGITSGGAATTTAISGIYRGASQILAVDSISGYGAAQGVSISSQYLDSPATTSSTTYTYYFASSNGNGVGFNINISAPFPTTSTITLMEIAG